MCWEREEYHENNRDFLKKHFEELDKLFGDDGDFDIGDIDFENIDFN